MGIDGQQFGLGHIEPAVFTTAERDEFDPRMDDYLVWRISFTCAAAFGTDPLHTMACPAVGLAKLYLIRAGNHVDDYQFIWEAQPDE